MRGRMATLALVGLLTIGVALAGCLGDEPAPAPVVEEPAPVIPLIAPANRTVERADCVLYSQGYPAPSSQLEQFVPEGFQLAGGSRVPGTTNIAVYVTLCSGIAEEVQPGNVSALDADTIEIVAAFPVIPPEGERDENVTRNYVPLLITVQGGKLHERYLDWGFAIAETGSVTQSRTDDGTAFQSGVAWSDSSGSYTIDAAGQAGGSVTAKTWYRLWAVQDGKAVGSILVENDSGKAAGTGVAVFTYDGAGPAPPVAAGTTSDGTGINGLSRYVGIGQSIPPLSFGS